MNVPAQCVLCNTGIETHHHRFFECEFSVAIGSFFARKVWPNPPQDIHSAAAWILLSRNPSYPQPVCIVKLVLQSTIYHIWKERNSQIFTSKASTPAVVQAAVEWQIRDRLLSIPASPHIQPSFLQFFLACTIPP